MRRSSMKEQTQKSRENTIRVETGPVPGTICMNVRSISVRGRSPKEYQLHKTKEKQVMFTEQHAVNDTEAATCRFHFLLSELASQRSGPCLGPCRGAQPMLFIQKRCLQN